MLFFAIVLILFGVIVLFNPAIIAYLIGFFFIFAGVNILTLAIVARRNIQNNQSGWTFGGYEITRRSKK